MAFMEEREAVHIKGGTTLNGVSMGSHPRSASRQDHLSLLIFPR